MSDDGDTKITEGVMVAVMGGGDWADASVDHLVALRPFSHRETTALWRKWYEGEYCPALHDKTLPNVEFVNYPEWLVAEGYARLTSGDDIKELWDW